jgi:hypothetical protein
LVTSQRLDPGPEYKKPVAKPIGKRPAGDSTMLSRYTLQHDAGDAGTRTV